MMPLLAAAQQARLQTFAPRCHPQEPALRVAPAAFYIRNRYAVLISTSKARVLRLPMFWIACGPLGSQITPPAFVSTITGSSLGFVILIRPSVRPIVT